MTDTFRPTIYPTLRYADAPAAIRFLTGVFGLAEHQVMTGEDGTIGHAELSWGPCMVMLGSAGTTSTASSSRTARWRCTSRSPTSTPTTTGAVAAGAEILRPLADTDYGSREYTTRDPEGNIWSFGTYQPTVDD